MNSLSLSAVATLGVAAVASACAADAGEAPVTVAHTDTRLPGCRVTRRASGHASSACAGTT